MTDQTERVVARPTSQYVEIRGYLREELASATVSNDELTPTSAKIAVYGTDPETGIWGHIGEEIVWNYDESPSYCAKHYCRASLNSDGRFEQLVIHCEPTSLTIPDELGA